jgi:hypothetical protein
MRRGIGMPRLPKRVHILEMHLSKDHASEGEFLAEYFRVLGVQAELIPIRSRVRLKEELTRPGAGYIHISAHGGVTDQGTSFWISDWSWLSAGELVDFRRSLQGRVVVATACQTGKADMGRRLLALGCKYYIAPRRDTYWADAAVFSALLYRHHFDRGLTMDRAYKLSKEQAHAKGDWQLYTA